ncbi:Aldo/keto reductase [Dendrothele bispora CBS 962.96]|uniref:Aldo/keto reductase n=1 Tax=Dendrothele bispora (strain CBS 962.96) TaxID=1314807 RepID=A0A4S8KPU7_DENBC|nr:Aldo/keto reductase [Dendrothele bispora CBS 962.96]
MMKKIPTRSIGKNGPQVGAIGFGAMGVGAWYGKSDEEEILKTLDHALDKGVNFWDTSDIYGTSEAVLGKWFQKTGRRAEVFLCTKFGGFDPEGNPQDGVISKPSHIRKSVKRSLDLLKTDYIDLYYQHRVDPDVPIEIVLETLRPFVESGTIRYIGLSECSADTLRRAKAVPGVGEKLIAVQMEYSLFTLDVENNGIAEVCEELGVSLVAYSPLARGLVTGRFRSRADFDPSDLRLILPRWSEENFPKNLMVVDKITEIAQQYGITNSQVALAWILAEQPNWIPIPGSRTIQRLEENASSAEIELPTEAIKTIRTLTENAEIAGTRNRTLTWIARGVAGDCIPMDQWKGE